MAAESVPVTVEVLARALQNTAPPWYSSGPVLALLGVFVGALIGFGGNWYLKQMDRDSWFQQKRWEWKWQCYSQLAEHYGELHTLLLESTAMAHAIDAAQSTEREKLTAERDRRLAAIRDRFELARRWGSIARIVVPPDTRTFITRFGDRWNAADGNSMGQSTAAREAWLGILDHAREDLRFERRES